ncbi:MAG: glycosyltransferase family 1 protein, partial [Chloroflexi bacterium]
YRGATASALLSLDEGFGFPALEAMACGCPTLLSNAPALVEVAGGAAVIVDAMDVTAVAKTIVRLCADADFRQDVGERGLGRARHFTWARAASEYGVVYRSVVDSA